MTSTTTSAGTRAVRTVRVVLHLVRGVAIAAGFRFMDKPRRQHEIRRWSRQLLALLSVELHVAGEVPDAAPGTPAMLVGNHMSWLDIFAINAVRPARFVSKAEVRQWPLIGWLSVSAGTLFIERARRRDTVRINDAVTAALRGGDLVAVFPEGTATDGTAVHKFHSSLLEPAITAGAAVHPVAIRYTRADGTLCTEAGYDGDKTLWDSFTSMIGQPVIRASLDFLPPLPVGSSTRREIAQAARDAIERRLFSSDPRSRTGTGAGLPAASR
jgi:1-acyl-sn-glycerol-3-phosphate acyltransferase